MKGRAVELSPAAWTAVSGIVIAAIAALTSPQWVKRLEARDPARGWQAAINALESRITSQDETIKQQNETIQKQNERIDSFEREIRNLEGELVDAKSTVTRKEATIQGQSRTIEALTRRITQLETAWPAGLTLPPIDPAYAEVLRPSTG